MGGCKEKCLKLNPILLPPVPEQCVELEGLVRNWNNNDVLNNCDDWVR